jgi:hypothetical protein
MQVGVTCTLENMSRRSTRCGKLIVTSKIKVVTLSGLQPTIVSYNAKHLAKFTKVEEFCCCFQNVLGYS